MRNDLNKQIQFSVRNWVDIEKWERPFAFTLTHKKSIVHNNGKQNVPVYLSHDIAIANFRHFLNVSNRDIYGNSHQRYGKKLKVFPLIEGSETKHFHYHGVIECPQGMASDVFKNKIRSAWLKTDWGHVQMDIKSYADTGWIDYITKLRDKYSVTDSIDWDNTYF